MLKRTLFSFVSPFVYFAFFQDLEQRKGIMKHQTFIGRYWETTMSFARRNQNTRI